MKLLFLIIFVFSIISCSKTTDNNDSWTWILEETKQIINDYPDTLESSIKDAKKVRDQYNENGKELEKSIIDSKVN